MEFEVIEEIEVTIDEIKNWEPDTYEIIDIREESAAAYGIIPGSVNFPQADLPQYLDCLHREKKQLVYCMKGVLSLEAVEFLREKGFQAYSLSGGYHAYLIDKMRSDEQNEKERAEKIPCLWQSSFRS